MLRTSLICLASVSSVHTVNYLLKKRASNQEKDARQQLPLFKDRIEDLICLADNPYSEKLLYKIVNDYSYQSLEGLIERLKQYEMQHRQDLLVNRRSYDRVRDLSALINKVAMEKGGPLVT